MATQKSRVLEAVQMGAETVYEVEALVDLPLKHIAAHLWKLTQEGRIEVVERSAVRLPGNGGVSAHRYRARVLQTTKPRA